MTKVESLPNVKLLQLDITKPADIRAAADAVRNETGGTLTYLVNCAARNYFMPLLDEALEDARDLFELNVWGQLAVTQAFAPMLIKARGTVVFISSLSGYLNVPYQGVFAASKRSAEIMAETLRLELAPFHVKVLSVVTGPSRRMGRATSTTGSCQRARSTCRSNRPSEAAPVAKKVRRGWSRPTTRTVSSRKSSRAEPGSSGTAPAPRPSSS
jgi:NAD(P)-dependent dehydrogenase (short-subunit alcohol dehydrogenase family)